MKVGIEARAILSTGGTRTYVINLIENIAKIDKINEYYILTPIKTNLKLPKNFNEIIIPIKNQLHMLYWEHFTIPKLVKKYNIDVLHYTKNSSSFQKKCKIVTTVHDLAPIIFPESQTKIQKYYWKFQLPLSINKADKIIAISKYTKQDIINKFYIDKNRIQVIYEGYNKDLFNFGNSNNEKEMKKISKKYKLPTNFILFVGNLQHKKNIQTVIQSLNYIKKKSDKELFLVIVGKIAWKSSLVYENIKKYGLEKQVIFTGRVEDEELPTLYGLAKLFIFPSYYEGFGLPILEAQACGCPVITSNVTSIPEVIGDKEVQVNPDDYKSMSKLFVKVYEDDNFRNKLIQKGKNNIKKFDWLKYAKETINVYEEVVKGE